MRKLYDFNRDDFHAAVEAINQYIIDYGEVPSSDSNNEKERLLGKLSNMLSGVKQNKQLDNKRLKTLLKLVNNIK